MWVPALLKENHGAEEMARQVKDQNADPQNPCKAREHGCKPVSQYMKGGDRIPRTSWLARLASWKVLGPSGRLCLHV